MLIQYRIPPFYSFFGPELHYPSRFKLVCNLAKERHSGVHVGCFNAKGGIFFSNSFITHCNYFFVERGYPTEATITSQSTIAKDCDLLVTCSCLVGKGLRPDTFGSSQFQFQCRWSSSFLQLWTLPPLLQASYSPLAVQMVMSLGHFIYYLVFLFKGNFPSHPFLCLLISPSLMLYTMTQSCIHLYWGGSNHLPRVILSMPSPSVMRLMATLHVCHIFSDGAHTSGHFSVEQDDFCPSWSHLLSILVSLEQAISSTVSTCRCSLALLIMFISLL